MVDFFVVFRVIVGCWDVVVNVLVLVSVVFDVLVYGYLFFCLLKGLLMVKLWKFFCLVLLCVRLLCLFV